MYYSTKKNHIKEFQNSSAQDEAKADILALSRKPRISVVVAACYKSEIFLLCAHESHYCCNLAILAQFWRGKEGFNTP